MLVLVVAVLDEAELTTLEQALASARRRRDLPARFVFHYSQARPSIRDAFFQEVAPVPFSAWASVIDKWSWSSTYLRESSGDERLRSEIVRLLLSLPENAVSGQKLAIDYPTAESGKVQAIRKEVTLALRMQQRQRYRSVKPCPDHRLEGTIIQLTDMIAGALHDGPEASENYFRQVGERLKVL